MFSTGSVSSVNSAHPVSWDGSGKGRPRRRPWRAGAAAAALAILATTACAGGHTVGLGSSGRPHALGASIEGSAGGASAGCAGSVDVEMDPAE